MDSNIPMFKDTYGCVNEKTTQSKSSNFVPYIFQYFKKIHFEIVPNKDILKHIYVTVLTP